MALFWQTIGIMNAYHVINNFVEHNYWLMLFNIVGLLLSADLCVKAEHVKEK